MTALFADLIVNGEVVPSASIAAEAQNHSGPKGKPGIAWRKAANALAVRTLLLQEARARGVQPDVQQISAGRFETEEEALIRGLLEQEIVAEPPSEAEVEAQWARDPDRFRAPPLWEVSHILCACDPRDQAESKAAYARAVDLNGRALGNPEGFARLAREHSDCGSRAQGGNLGQLRPGDSVPEFEAVVEVMSEGEITAEPILSRHGWHIIRLDARAVGAVLPYGAVRQKLAEAMEKAAWARAAQALLERLAANATISGADLHRPILREASHDRGKPS